LGDIGTPVRRREYEPLEDPATAPIQEPSPNIEPVEPAVEPAEPVFVPEEEPVPA
jgi:hypothetical protein